MKRHRCTEVVRTAVVLIFDPLLGISISNHQVRLVLFFLFLSVFCNKCLDTVIRVEGLRKTVGELIAV